MQMPSHFERLIRAVERNHGQYAALMRSKHEPTIPQSAYDSASQMFAIADRYAGRSDKVEIG